MNMDILQNNRSFTSAPHKLVIAEKPSVAQSIAAVLGASQRKDGYLEGKGYIVSWCVGHLVQLAPPDAYDEKYAKWRREDLPIVPEAWRYAVSPGTKRQFDILKRLMTDAQVSSIVCATDAGREGELIFRLVYDMCKCVKPIERLWISSLEESAIQKGFQNLKPGSAYDALYHAALCRAQADWLVGMNVTRLLSTTYHHTLSVGRVMTPTLALVVAREEAIASFQPVPFYTVELDCGVFTAASEKYALRAEAESIVAQCSGNSCTITLHKRKLDGLKELKHGYLQQMFPQAGERVPRVRFAGFTEPWTERTLGGVVERIQGNDGRMELPTLTISSGRGWLDQRDRFSSNIAGQEQANYTLLSKGGLSYNKGNSKSAKYGVVYELKNHEEALVPRVYHSFIPTDESSAQFIEYMFATKTPDRELAKLITSGARMDGLLNINYESFASIKLCFPSRCEQNSIGDFFRNIDDQINASQQKLHQLQQLKSAYLPKMFI